MTKKVIHTRDVHTCSVCGNWVPWKKMAEHFKRTHPEYPFHLVRRVNGHPRYACNYCQKMPQSFRELVRHYRFSDHFKNALISEIKETLPEEKLDTFFASLGETMKELQTLRQRTVDLELKVLDSGQRIVALQQEVEHWKTLATKWAERLAEAQEVMSRR